MYKDTVSVYCTEKMQGEVISDPKNNTKNEMSRKERRKEDVMVVKKVRRRCGVRNCKHTECYAISKTREAGNSVIICKDCLEEALQRINGAPAEDKEPRKTEIPPLFFNTQLQQQEESATKEAMKQEDGKKQPEEMVICEKCNRTFASAAALKRHRCRGGENQ